MMGLLRFELRSQRPERCRMDQATLQPPIPFLLVPPERVNNLHVGEQHTPATVSLYAQVIEDFASWLGLYALSILLPDVRDNFSA